MSRELQPQNLGPEELAAWEQVMRSGDELLRDTAAAAAKAQRLPEWLQEDAVNVLYAKLDSCRALLADWMNDHGEP